MSPKMAAMSSISTMKLLLPSRGASPAKERSTTASRKGSDAEAAGTSSPADAHSASAASERSSVDLPAEGSVGVGVGRGGLRWVRGAGALAGSRAVRALAAPTCHVGP